MNDNKRTTPLFVGTTLLILSIVFNKYFIEFFFFSGELNNIYGYILIFVSQCLLAALGLYFLIKRPFFERLDFNFLLNCTISFFFVVLAFSIVDAAANFWLMNFARDNQLAFYGTYSQAKQARNVLFTRHHYMMYSNKPNYRKPPNRHNSLGYKGEEISIKKPTGIYRIVAIGGSTTYSQADDSNYKKSYPYLLEKRLHAKGFDNVQVINAGVKGYSSFESLMNLQFRVLDLNPDMIIIYHGINDVHNRLVYPFSNYQGDNSGSRRPYRTYQESVWDRSTALRILRTRFGLREYLGGIGFLVTYHRVETNYADEFEVQKLNNTYPSGIFEKVPAMEMIKENSPTFFRRNLKNMVAIAQTHNIKPILTTFAWSQQFDAPRVSSREYNFALKQHNQVIKDLCVAEDLQCFDLHTKMPAEKQYWNDGRHVSEKGVRIKSKLIANFLLKEKLIPKP